MEAGGRRSDSRTAPGLEPPFGRSPATAWGIESDDIQAAIGELEEKLMTLRRARDEADDLKMMGEFCEEIEAVTEDLAHLRFRHLGALDSPVVSTQPAPPSPWPKSTGFGPSVPKPLGSRLEEAS